MWSTVQIKATWLGPHIGEGGQSNSRLRTARADSTTHIDPVKPADRSLQIVLHVLQAPFCRLEQEHLASSPALPENRLQPEIPSPVVQPDEHDAESFISP